MKIMLKRLTLMLLILLLCVGCDQTTKLAAESYLGTHGLVSYLGGTVRFQLAHNSGAFLSLGAALPAAIREGFFTLGVGFLLLGLLGYAIFVNTQSMLMFSALALLFAGGVGNLIDRVIHEGYVIDFINIGIGSLRTGVFNVADVAISSGALLLIVEMQRQPAENEGTHI